MKRNTLRTCLGFATVASASGPAVESPEHQPPLLPEPIRRQPAPIKSPLVPFETPDPQYRAYFNQVREKIKAPWIYPRPEGDQGIEGEVLIEFHIAKDGRLEFVELRHSSRRQALNDAALTAVKKAQPFPPVPDAVAKRTLTISGSFRHQVNSGPGSAPFRETPLPPVDAAPRMKNRRAPE